MNADILKLLVELHVDNDRQGPGSDEILGKVLDMLCIDKTKRLKIADIGCGTGSSTLSLLRLTSAEITAVDFVREFLEKLEKRAEKENLNERLITLQADMAELPFQKEDYDIIWSEGSIYNIGFERGVKAWRKFIKNDGFFVVSEITWINPHPPEKLRQYWQSEYPEIDTAANKINLLEENGYILWGYFVLPQESWLDNYYIPLQNGFDKFLVKNQHSSQARKLIQEYQQEIKIYKKYSKYYSYGVYVAKKI